MEDRTRERRSLQEDSRYPARRTHRRTTRVGRSFPLLVVVFLAAAGLAILITALVMNDSSSNRPAKRAARSSNAKTPHSRPKPATHTTRTGAPQPQSTGPLLSPAAADNFAALESRLPGKAGVAVAPLGQGSVQTLGGFQVGHAWSTMKVPVLVTLLRDYARTGRSLSQTQQNEAQLALEQSDNAAAGALFSDLESIHGGLVPASAAVQRTLVAAGDSATTVNTAPNSDGWTTWGQSIWSTTGETEFYRSLARGCLLAPANTSYVLGLMRSVIPAQRWGAGAAGYPASVPLGFKAGWGPESSGGYLVRQTAIVGAGDRGYVLSMIALPSSGSFSEGVSMITELATWARHNIPVRGAARAGCLASR